MIKQHLKHLYQLYAANCAAVYAPDDFFTTQRFTKERLEEILSPYDHVMRAETYTHTTWFEARRHDNDKFEIVRCEEMSPKAGMLMQEPYLEEKYKPINSDIALFPQKNVRGILSKLEEQLLKSKVWAIAKRQPYRATFYDRPQARL